MLNRILILFYSAGGHMEQLAKAAAEGARGVTTNVALKRIPEVTGAVNLKDGQDAGIDVATPLELAEYDGIMLGVPTRFGMMCAQVRHFLDQTGPLWMKGALVGKAGGVMASSATQHGGQESTILSAHTTLLHHGMIIVGLPYTSREQMSIDEISGGSPYGASTITGGGGPRFPSNTELTLAKAHGLRLAEVAGKLAAV